MKQAHSRPVDVLRSRYGGRGEWMLGGGGERPRCAPSEVGACACQRLKRVCLGQIRELVA